MSGRLESHNIISNTVWDGGRVKDKDAVVVLVDDKCSSRSLRERTTITVEAGDWVEGANGTEVENLAKYSVAYATAAERPNIPQTTQILWPATTIL